MSLLRFFILLGLFLVLSNISFAASFSAAYSSEDSLFKRVTFFESKACQVQIASKKVSFKQKLRHSLLKRKLEKHQQKAKNQSKISREGTPKITKKKAHWSGIASLALSIVPYLLGYWVRAIIVA